MAKAVIKVCADYGCPTRPADRLSHHDEQPAEYQLCHVDCSSTPGLVDFNGWSSKNIQ